MKLNEIPIKSISQWSGFGVVLITSLSISWWSMFTMAMNEFGMPAILAAAVSVAFDGAAVFVAILASEYSKSNDSGMIPRIVTVLFVLLSAYLNWAHAALLVLPFVGKVFLAAPSVVSGILFELYLRFVHRTEMRANGLVPKRMPVFGKISWLIFPGKTYGGFKDVVFFRLNEVVTSVTGQSVTREKVSRDKKRDKVTSDKPVTGQSDMSPVTKDKSVTMSQDKMTKPVTKSVTVTSDKSVSLLVRELWDQGVTDRTELHKKICHLKGTTVPMNTVTKAVSRLDNVPGA